MVAAVVGPDDAEDVVQEALIRAWRLTKAPPEDWAKWLFRIAVNAAKDHLEARRGELLVLSVDKILEDEDKEEW